MRGTIHNLQARFENYVALTASQPTSVRYSKALNNFFDHFTDKFDPEDFSRKDIEDYKIYRLREKVSSKTVNYEVQVVKSFWNWLVRMEASPYNPCTTTKRLKEVEPAKRSLSLEDQEKVYEAVSTFGSPLDNLLVGLALSTGLRAETLIRLETADVDFETATLRIPAAKMKAGRNHEVPIRQDVMELIKELPEGRFFNGYSRTARSLSDRFSRILRRSGILGHRGLRTARRSFATTLLRTGTDIGLVQTLMGHRSVLTTSRYLTVADSATTKAAIDRLPKGASNDSHASNPNTVDGTNTETTGTNTDSTIN